MKTQLIGLAAFVLAGCATSDADTLAEDARISSVPGAMLCQAVVPQSYRGQRADPAIGAAILKDSGARTLRWGPPGGAWTMDYRQDRVNVEYDGQMMITRITCG